MNSELKNLISDNANLTSIANAQAQEIVDLLKFIDDTALDLSQVIANIEVNALEPYDYLKTILKNMQSVVAFNALKKIKLD